MGEKGVENDSVLVTEVIQASVFYNNPGHPYWPQMLEDHRELSVRVYQRIFFDNKGSQLKAFKSLAIYPGAAAKVFSFIMDAEHPEFARLRAAVISNNKLRKAILENIEIDKSRTIGSDYLDHLEEMRGEVNAREPKWGLVGKFMDQIRRILCA